MTSYRTKRRVLPTHPVVEKVYLTCPVCAHPQVELQGLSPYQTLQLHYKPGTQESCTNHGKDYHGSAPG